MDRDDRRRRQQEEIDVEVAASARLMSAATSGQPPRPAPDDGVADRDLSGDRRQLHQQLRWLRDGQQRLAAGEAELTDRTRLLAGREADCEQRSMRLDAKERELDAREQAIDQREIDSELASWNNEQT